MRETLTLSRRERRSMGQHPPSTLSTEPPQEVSGQEDAAPPIQPLAHTFPIHWARGQLLNVRNTGSEYVLTLLNEEYDKRHPDRAIFFPNAFECNAFLGWWYSREHADPRAG